MTKPTQKSSLGGDMVLFWKKARCRFVVLHRRPHSTYNRRSGHGWLEACPKIIGLVILSWGQAPKPPWLRFAEGYGYETILLRSRTTLFASFSGKRRLLDQLFLLDQKILAATDPRYLGACYDFTRNSAKRTQGVWGRAPQ
jgi:hypothetical protein